MPKQLKAFTILELLVAMAITGIVVSIAGVSYNILMKQFHSYKEINAKVASVFTLHNRLSHDLMQADIIIKQDDTILLTRTGKPEIEYTFSMDNLLRAEQGRTDTFYIQADNVIYSFLNSDEEKAIVEMFSFEASILGERELFRYRKQYSADIILQLQEE